MIVQHLAIQNAIHQSHLFMRNSFIDFFPFQPERSVESQTVTRAYHQGVHIHNVVFDEFRSSSAVYYSLISLPVYLYIEKTSFANCENGDEGGAIYYNGNSGGCALSSVCGYNCYSDDIDGQLCYISTKELENDKIILNLTSATRCSPPFINGFRCSSIYLKNGNVTIRNLNSTNNYLSYTSGLQLRNAKQSSIQFANFVDNVVSYYAVIALIHLETCLHIDWIRSINMIRNNSPDPNGGIIHGEIANINTTNSIFLDNFGTLFFGKSGHITVNNCFLKHGTIFPIFNTTRSTTSSVITTDIYTQTLQIERFATYYCILDFILPVQTPCMTIPLPPTGCPTAHSPSASGLSLLNSFKFLLSSFLSSSYI